MNLARIRSRSLATLGALGLPETLPLPLLEPDLALRSPLELAHRINLLHIGYAISLRGGDTAGDFYDLVCRNGWEPFLSDTERARLKGRVVSGQALIDLSWNKEAIKALLWAGSQVEADLEGDFGECDFAVFYPLLPPARPFDAFVRDLCLRPKEQIVEKLDLYYGLHWCCRRRERLEGARVPVLPSVVLERRRALEWLTHPVAWDAVSLDT